MRSSGKPRVLVLGTGNLNNSYLGVTLELDGFKVDYLDFQDFVETSPEKYQNHFCLIDFQCNKEVVGELEIFAPLKDTVSPRYALFNVCPDHIKNEKMLELVRKGLAGVFFEGESLEMICRGVRIILEGEIWFPRKLMAQMFLGDISAPPRTSHSEQQTIGILTVREKEVLVKLASGASNQEIAEALFISIPTVKTHASRVYEKIGVASRLQAALWLAKNG